MDAEVQLKNGEREEGTVYVKASGWVEIDDGQSYVHYPPQKVERIVGSVTYQSPHGRV